MGSRHNLYINRNKNKYFNRTVLCPQKKNSSIKKVSYCIRNKTFTGSLNVPIIEEIKKNQTNNTTKTVRIKDKNKCKGKEINIGEDSTRRDRKNKQQNSKVVNNNELIDKTRKKITRWSKEEYINNEKRRIERKDINIDARK